MLFSGDEAHANAERESPARLGVAQGAGCLQTLDGNRNGHMASLADDGEFVSAHAPNYIGFAECLLENFCYFDKVRGANIVAEGVIDLFQVVQIDE